MAIGATHKNFEVIGTGDLDIYQGCCYTNTSQLKTVKIFMEGIKEPLILNYIVKKQSSFFSRESCQVQIPGHKFATNWCYGSPAENNCLEQLCHHIEKIYGQKFPCNHHYEPGCLFKK